jgi:hypothetical protein
MTREDFSIDHKTPWLDTDSPVDLFFDLENIAYSHKGCNARAASRPWSYATEEDRVVNKRRRQREFRSRHDMKPVRRAKYLRTGT